MIRAATACIVMAGAHAAPVTHTMANGCSIVVSSEPSAGRVAAVLMVRAGDVDDPPSAPGANRVLSRLVMDAANHRAPARFGAAAVDGEMRVDAELDVTSYSIVTVPAQIGGAIRTLAMLAEPPLWNNTTVMRAVAVEGEADRDAPPPQWERAFNAWQAKAGLPVPPPANADPPGREALRALHARLYVSNRFVLAIAGEVDVEATMALAEAVFGALPGEPDRLERRPPRSVSAEPLAGAPDYAFVGYPAPAAAAPDAPAMEVLATALGQGKTSPLFRRLRETEGTGYESGVTYPLRLSASGVALFTRAPGAAAAVRDDLAALWKGAVQAPAGGWDGARLRASLAWDARHQSVRDRAYWLAFWQTAGVGAGYDAEYRARLLTASDAAIVAAGKRWLRGEPVTTP